MTSPRSPCWKRQEARPGLGMLGYRALPIYTFAHLSETWSGFKSKALRAFLPSQNYHYCSILPRQKQRYHAHLCCKITKYQVWSLDLNSILSDPRHSTLTHHSAAHGAAWRIALRVLWLLSSARVGVGVRSGRPPRGKKLRQETSK